MTKLRAPLVSAILLGAGIVPTVSYASTIVDVFEATYVLESAELRDAYLFYDDTRVTLPEELGCDEGVCRSNTGPIDVLDSRWPGEFYVTNGFTEEKFPVNEIFASSVELKAEFLNGRLVSCTGLRYDLQFPRINGCNFGDRFVAAGFPGERFQITRSSMYEMAVISDQEFKVLTDYYVDFDFGPGLGVGSAIFGFDPTYKATQTSWTSFETTEEIGLLPTPGAASLALGGILSFAALGSWRRRNKKDS